jgi:hypothetical protein
MDLAEVPSRPSGSRHNRSGSNCKHAAASSEPGSGFRFVVAGWVLIGVGAIVALPKGNLRATTAQVVGLVAGLAALVAGVVLVVL